MPVTSDARNTFVDAIEKVELFLTDSCNHYEKTAPTVAAHCDELYIRIQQGSPVTLREILAVCSLRDGNTWDSPNYAANRIYKLREFLGMDTTGHAGF